MIIIITVMIMMRIFFKKWGMQCQRWLRLPHQKMFSCFRRLLLTWQRQNKQFYSGREDSDNFSWSPAHILSSALIPQMYTFFVFLQMSYLWKRNKQAFSGILFYCQQSFLQQRNSPANIKALCFCAVYFLCRHEGINALTHFAMKNERNKHFTSDPSELSSSMPMTFVRIISLALFL